MTGLSTIEIVLGIALIVISILLVLIIMLQSGKAANASDMMSGASAGYGGRENPKDKLLSRFTWILSLFFVAITIAISAIKIFS